MRGGSFICCTLVAVAAGISASLHSIQMALYFSLIAVVWCADSICRAIRERP